MDKKRPYLSRKRIRLRRLELDLKQRTISKQLGKDYGRFERGITNLPITYAPKLAEILEWDVTQLFDN